MDDGDWAAATVEGDEIVLDDQAWGTNFYHVRAVNAAGASPFGASNDVQLVEPTPQSYQAEYYYFGGQAWTYVSYTTVSGALSYEAQLDGGDWIPIQPEGEWGTQQAGTVSDPVCAVTACTGNRTIRVRAVTANGPGNPGNSFPVTYYILG